MTSPHEVSDDMLMALADAELPDAEVERLRVRIAADPDLAARYADFAETRTLLQAAFPPQPVPDRLIAAVLEGPTPSRQAAAAPIHRRLSVVSGWGIALAASIALAVAGFWAGRHTAPQISASGAEAIARELASTPTGAAVRLHDGSTARVLASYETDLGLCRLIDRDSLRHVTCRNAQTDDWSVALSVQAGNEDSFLPASNLAVGLVDRLLDDIGAGPALTPEEEAAALR